MGVVKLNGLHAILVFAEILSGAIIMSGSSLDPKYAASSSMDVASPRSAAVGLAGSAGCRSSDTEPAQRHMESLIDCLRTQSTAEILRADRIAFKNVCFLSKNAIFWQHMDRTSEF